MSIQVDVASFVRKPPEADQIVFSKPSSKPKNPKHDKLPDSDTEDVPIFINTQFCRYEIVREAARALKWKEYKGKLENWNLFWFDKSSSVERIQRLQEYQIINHFPGIHGIARKNPLCQNMERMRSRFGDAYNFYPQAWCLPQEKNKFVTWRESNKNRKEAFIIKPNAGSLGRGIILTLDPEMEVERMAGEAVVQRYIDNPYLIEGHKFDLRVYALITCVDPLRIYMYQEGIVRLCTEPYEAPTTSNVKTPYKHLTNYTLNKKNPNFGKAQSHEPKENEVKFSTGYKRSFQFLNQHFKKHDIDPQAIWDRIGDLLVKTIMSIQPSMKRLYDQAITVSGKKYSTSTCFELLGFDVLLDDQLNPWLIEVNHSPSLNLETKLDHEVKFGLIKECFQLLNIDPMDRVNVLKRQSLEPQARLGNEEAEKLLRAIPEVSYRRLPKSKIIENTIENEKQVINKYTLIYPVESRTYMEAFMKQTGPIRRRIVSKQNIKQTCVKQVDHMEIDF